MSHLRSTCSVSDVPDVKPQLGNWKFAENFLVITHNNASRS